MTGHRLYFEFIAKVEMEDRELLQRELDRERRARMEAERLLEEKSSELHAANQRLRRLYDYAADAIFVHDARGKIVDVNRTACEHLGYDRDELLAMTIYDTGTLPQQDLNHQWNDFPSDRPVQLDSVHHRRDGSTFPVEVRIARMEQNPMPLFLAIARDVSVRSRQRLQLEASRRRLRKLASQVTLTEAKERQQLAQVLHDTIGHDLAVVRMHVKKLNKLASGEREQAHCESAVRLIEDVVKRVRRVTFDLSPATLFELGLSAAVNVVARVVAEEHETACEVEAEGNWRTVPRNLEILLFYATRELIHNAIKHASASKIDVRMDRREHSVSISVIDDGVGFLSDKIGPDDDSAPFGLFCIRERLAGLGGELQISSELQLGTSVTMRVPCEPSEELTK